MSVTPYIKVVVGIVADYSSVVIPNKAIQAYNCLDPLFSIFGYEEVFIEDIVYRSSPYSDEKKGIFGVIIDKMGDDVLTRALFAVLENCGVFDGERLELEWPRKCRDGELHYKQDTEKALSEKRNFHYYSGFFSYHRTDNWYTVTVDILKACGLNVSRNELNTYIVMGWD